jgi:hypothetical protein
MLLRLVTVVVIVVLLLPFIVAGVAISCAGAVVAGVGRR